MEKSSQSFTLSLIGFGEGQRENFLAILSLAERRLQHTWYVTEVSEADFFLLATEKLDSASLVAEKNLPQNRCLFRTEQRLSEYDYDVLFIAPASVPLLSSVVNVLNYAANNGSFSEEIPSNSVSIAPLTESNKAGALGDDNRFFDPYRGFFKNLLENKTERLVYCFNSSANNYKLYVDPVKKVYYCATNLKSLDSCLIVEEAIEINVVSQAEWDNSVEVAALVTRPLSNLIWYIGFRLSHGRLLLGHSNEDCVYLTRWPDLGVAGCGQYVKLAAFMRNNAVSLTTIADKTSMPLSNVYNFYNACYLIDIVEKTATAELHTKILDEDKRILLKKITTRLNDINNDKKAT